MAFFFPGKGGGQAYTEPASASRFSSLAISCFTNFSSLISFLRFFIILRIIKQHANPSQRERSILLGRACVLFVFVIYC